MKGYRKINKIIQPNSILYWLNEIPCPEIMRRAVSQSDVKYSGARSIHEALKSGFSWETSEEGVKFWNEVYNIFKNNPKSDRKFEYFKQFIAK